MSLLSIKEPDKPELPKLAIGIDLGTTNSLISIYEDNQARIIARNKSIVAFNSDKEIIGSQVSDDDFTVISSSKRLMGKNINDINDYNTRSTLIVEDSKHIIKYKIKNRNDITPITIASRILKDLKNQAELLLGQEITHAVITVPAYFDESAKSATKLALTSIGIAPLRLINEPTAAALAYGFEKNAKGNYLIYDLGGGTFDVSILKMQKGIFKVIASVGDNMLGGDDIDKLIADHLFISNKNNDYNSQLIICKNLKEQLAIKDIAKFGDISLTKDKFNQLIDPVVDKTIDMIIQLLREKDIKHNEIDQIVLVGGSTRINQVKDKLKNLFNKTPLSDINPDDVVALGACLQAASLCGKIDSLLIDILPLSIGVEMMGGLVEKIIERGTAIPISKSQKFTTQIDNQTSIKFHIVQGERELAGDCRSLANFALNNIKPLPANTAKITTIFNIDADGLLTVTAKDDLSDQTQEITVKPTYGLSKDEIEQIIANSYEFAQQDMKNKILIQAKLKLQNLLDKIDNDLTKYTILFTDLQKQAVNNSLAQGRIAIDNYDVNHINETEEEMKNILNMITELKLKEYLKKFKGQNLNDIEQFVKSN